MSHTFANALWHFHSTPFPSLKCQCGPLNQLAESKHGRGALRVQSGQAAWMSFPPFSLLTELLSKKKKKKATSAGSSKEPRGDGSGGGRKDGETCDRISSTHLDVFTLHLVGAPEVCCGGIISLAMPAGAAFHSGWLRGVFMRSSVL